MVVLVYESDIGTPKIDSYIRTFLITGQMFFCILESIPEKLALITRATII